MLFRSKRKEVDIYPSYFSQYTFSLALLFLLSGREGKGRGMVERGGAKGLEVNDLKKSKNMIPEL